MKLENEEIISNPAQVNKENEAFYRNMYTAKINDNMDNLAYEQKCNDFIENLNILVSLQLNVIISTVRIYSHRKLKQLWKHAPTTRGATALTNFSNFMSVFSCVLTPL